MQEREKEILVHRDVLLAEQKAIELLLNWLKEETKSRISE